MNYKLKAPNKCNKQIAGLLLSMVCAGMTNTAWSSAFQLMEQNVTNLGTAYAGTASLAIDASTGFFNSAGLTRICEEQIAVSAIGVKTNGNLQVTRALNTTGTPLVNPTLPSNARLIGDGLVPGLHYALRLNDCLVFGLNVTMPFGLKTGYREDGAARYSSTRSEIRVYDISPSLAYSFNNGLSLGAGLDFMHAFAQLDTRITVLPGGTPLTDGFREDRAERWGLGGHLGLLYEFDECARVGFNYRSEVKINARGESVQQLTATAPTTRSALSAGARLPSTAVISGYYELTECWAFMGDIQWTDWKRFQALSLTTVPGGTQTVTHDFRNTLRYALGTHYQLTDCFLLRFGVAYDESPVVNAHRTTRIPDSHRSWIALGGRYTIADCLNLDIGYAHVFFKRVDINESAPTASGGGLQGLQQLDGNIRSNVDMFGLQVTWDLA